MNSSLWLGPYRYLEELIEHVREYGTWWNQKQGGVWTSQGSPTMGPHGTYTAGTEGGSFPLLKLRDLGEDPYGRNRTPGSPSLCTDPRALSMLWAEGNTSFPPQDITPWIRVCFCHQGAAPDLLVTQGWVNIKWFETPDIVLCLLFGEQIFPLIIFCEILAAHAIPHIYFCSCSQPTDVVIAEVNPWFRNLGQRNYGFSFSFLM